MLRRLCAIQPASFAFTPANQAWAEGQVTKFPEGRQASAVIAILWRAQEQEGWLTRAAIEHVAGMLGLAYIRALEVATFYFMFHLQPVGRIAHFQICGTTSCMICGAEDLIAVCRELIAPKAHQVSPDGKFSWEEVECLGSCTNAPMAQIGKDYYEDLTPDILRNLIGRFSDGEVPVPGPQNGRFSSEPLSGLTSLKDFTGQDHNASVQAAIDIGETVKRIDGTEVPLLTPWRRSSQTPPDDSAEIGAQNQPRPSKGKPVDQTGITEQESTAPKTGRPKPGEPAKAADESATDHEDGASAAERPEPRRFSGTSGADDPIADDVPRDSVEKTSVASEVSSEVADLSGDGARSLPSMGQRGDGVSGSGRTGPQHTIAGPVDAVSATRGSKVVDSAPENRQRADPTFEISLTDGAPPPTFAVPRGGKADNLKQINGIGPKLENVLNGFGFWHFDQIADWTDANVAWVEGHLTGFKGRVTRDGWISQARILATGGVTDLSRGGDKSGAD